MPQAKHAPIKYLEQQQQSCSIIFHREMKFSEHLNFNAVVHDFSISLSTFLSRRLVVENRNSHREELFAMTEFNQFATKIFCAQVAID